VAVHGDDQGSEVTHAELPQAFGHQFLELDLLDGLDLGRLEGRGPARDGEVHAAELLQDRQRVGEQAALADDRAYPVLLHEPARETVHAGAGRGPDAELLVAPFAEGAHVRGGVEHGGAGEVHARHLAAIEDGDLRRVADADHVSLEAQPVAGVQGAQGVEVGDGEGEAPLVRAGLVRRRLVVALRSHR